jgi:beta-N-acetylhexosaminidase
MSPTPRHDRPRDRRPDRRIDRRSAAVARRRFFAVLIVCAVVAGVAAWAFAPDPEPQRDSRPAASTAPEKRGERQAPGLALSRAVGRKIMTSMDGTFPSRSLRARVRRGEVGGVILFGPNVGPGLGRAIRSLQHNAQAGGNPPLLIAVDQEGGMVKRFAALPPSRAPAQMDATTAGTEGAATGKALRARGVNTNLAPVADVNHGSFLGTRSFGSEAGQVSLAACGFASGLQSAGVNATLKHFPGLGRTAQNTDLQQVSVPASAAALRSDLAPYARCGGEARLVMLANATYPALDPRRPAVLSPRIVTDLLRGELRYGGVTITDTLAAPGVRAETTGVRASRAGVDILLYVGETASARGYRTLLAAARAGRLSRPDVLASAARIDALPR